ncbi:MAG TPA: hypothetical protein VGE62_02875 [Candidatus Paceibacterota bacterium]
MKNLLISTTMIKSAIFYATATFIVFGAYFAAPIATQAATTTYVVDITGNGCGAYCAELEAYLASINANANGSSTNNNVNASTTQQQNALPAPLSYQYSSSTLAYYKNNQSPAATSSLYKYPTYSYFRNPNMGSTSQYGYYQYPTQQYVYYGGKVPAKTQAKAQVQPNYSTYQPMPTAKLPGFIMTSGN